MSNTKDAIFFAAIKVFSTNLAPLTSSSTMCLILILLNDSNAVSEAEKKPDNISIIISIII